MGLRAICISSRCNGPTLANRLSSCGRGGVELPSSRGQVETRSGVDIRYGGHTLGIVGAEVVVCIFCINDLRACRKWDSDARIYLPDKQQPNQWLARVACRVVRSLAGSEVRSLCWRRNMRTASVHRRGREHAEGALERPAASDGPTAMGAYVLNRTDRFWTDGRFGYVHYRRSASTIACANALGSSCGGLWPIPPVRRRCTYLPVKRFA